MSDDPATGRLVRGLSFLLDEMWRSRIAVVSTLLLGVIWLGIWHHRHTEMQAGVIAAQRDMSNIARAFAEEVEDGIETIDHSLRLAQRFSRSAETFETLKDWLPPKIARSGYLARILLIDATGSVRNPEALGAIYPVDVSDRDYFAYQKRSFQDRLFIGEPMIGRATRQFAIPFSRRVQDEKGDFNGAVLVAVRPEYFSQTYAKMELGSKRITLVNSSGVILARGDESGYSAGASHPLTEAIIASANRDCFVDKEPTRDERRIYCSRSVTNTPLFVLVSQPLRDVASSADTHDQRLLFGYLLSLLCAPLIVDSVFRQRKLDKALRDKEQACAAANNSERQLRYTLENMRHGIMLIDRDGSIRVWNEAAFHIMGLVPPPPGKRITNDDLHVMLRECGVESAFADLGELAEAMGLGGDSVVCAAGPDGRVVKVWTTPVSDGYVRKIEDITQAYLTEQTRAASRQRELEDSRRRAAFVARITHEIRTPLHATIGFSRLLAREHLPSAAREIASELHASTSHLITIIDDILDFSSINAGHMHLKNGPVNIREIVDQVAKMGQMMTGSRPVRIDVKVAPQTPTTFHGEGLRIKQVLTNLVSNAVKFTERGTVTLAVYPGEGSLTLEVSDTGCGIARSELATIFEPFLRAQQAYGKPGAGLGLAIVRELVLQMGGAVDVYSEPDEVTTFRVSLPLRDVAPQQQPQAVAALPPPRSMEILVADDTRSSLRLIRMLLEAKGHAVTTVADGAQAVDACAGGAFDLVLLDLQMPVMDGFKAGEIISAQMRQDGRRTLLAALTAQVSPESQTAARKAGIEAFLRKPFDDADLDLLLAQAASTTGRAPFWRRPVAQDAIP